MRLILCILYFLIYSQVCLCQDSKKISQIFFPDFELNISTPAFDKKKVYKYHEMMSFLDDLKVQYPKEIQIKFIGKSQKVKTFQWCF